MKISIFNAFAPMVHLGALRSVASQLDLELLAIVAEPYAVARCLGGEGVQQQGALFIDVGGGTTDVALVRQGGVESTRMFALGGRAFTKSLGDRLELPFSRAEELKIDYARGVEIKDADVGPNDHRGGRGGLGRRRGADPRGVRQAGSAAGPHRAVRRWLAAAADRGRAARAGVRRGPAVHAAAAGQHHRAVGGRGASRTRPSCSSTSRTSRRWRWRIQAIELAGPEAPLDAALRKVVKLMRV